MKKKANTRDWLPLLKGRAPAGPPATGEAFRSEWIDFERGIRVGRLEPHERITQILKYHLEQTFDTSFLTDRWGRGVFWQWICWLPKANRKAKPISNNINFGCAKLFMMIDRSNRVFKCGLQVERGCAEGPAKYPGTLLKDDWDWHRLMRECRKGSTLDREFGRLLRHDGFVVEIGAWDANAVFTVENFRSAQQIRRAAGKCAKNQWQGFQLYYPMPEDEVRGCTGYELVTAIKGVFREVIPAMNVCMQVTLTEE